MTDSRPCRLVLIGFGTVGQGFVQILRDRSDWLAQRYGLTPRIVGLATRRSGSLYDPAGLAPAQLLAAAASPTGLSGLAGRQDWEPQELIARAEADLLVEISATDLLTGNPATSYIRAAIKRRMHVVTANKGPIALNGRALLAEARAAGVGLGYEGTVMSGTPGLRLGISALAGCELRSLRGIVNGTTNYILTRMEQGLAYADALAEAQRLGYAEADPTGDVEGYDAAGKALILANMLMDANLRLSDVAREGITRITSDDIAAAAASGERWKLIAEVTREGAGVSARVGPQRLPISHPLAGVSRSTNAITYTTDLLGDVTLIGPGAGGIPTGFALLADILALYGRA